MTTTPQPQTDPRSEVERLHDELELANVKLEACRVSLRYISSPTMGLPANVDPAMWAMYGAKEQLARQALRTCIQNAKATLFVIGDRADPN